MSFLVFVATVFWPAFAHEQTLPAEVARLAQASQNHGGGTGAGGKWESDCRLRVRLRDAASKEPLYGLIRAIGPDGPVFIEGLQERPAGWFSSPPDAELRLPPGVLFVEAAHGLETLVASTHTELAAGAARELVIDLKRFYDPSARRLFSANTHLHLRLDARRIGVLLRSREEADDYLRKTSASDRIDLLYVSYLTRPGETESYVSNDYVDADFEALGNGLTMFAGGIEHRHGGQRVGVRRFGGTGGRTTQTMVMTYGHVMLLNLKDRAIPASIGPGLSDDPSSTDGVALRDGIVTATDQGAFAIWCHGTYGLENAPDWIARLLHAQNIYDGGSQGSFDTVFYPLLTAGYRVPFSTGTDWGVYDFSRVYVPCDSEFSSPVFLEQLAAGRSFITNEPFLEFKVNDSVSGGTVKLKQPGAVRVVGRAIGRSDFVRMQVIRNGLIVHEEPSREVGGHFESAVDLALPVDESGWVALRIQPTRGYSQHGNESGPGVNIFGREIFAHTSPVYLTVAERPVFDAQALEHLLARVREARDSVGQLGSFGTEEEYQRIRRIYTDAEASLQSRLSKSGAP